MLGAVDRTREVKMIVPHGVAADTGNVLCKPSIDDGTGGWPWGNVAGNKRESPGRRAVPQVLDRGIVVQRQAVRERLTKQLAIGAGGANVGVVPAEVVGLRVVGHLREAAYMASPSAGEKQRNCLRKFEIAVLRGRLRSLRRRE